MTTRLRGAAKMPTPQKNQKKQKTAPSAPQNAGMRITNSFPSTSIGTSITASKPIMTRDVNSARLVGRDFIGTVECNGVSTFGLGKSALLSPAYFSSTFLGNLARSFEKYRWNKLVIHYVPKVATTATGQVILCSQRSVSEPCLSGEQGNFLARAMSQGNAQFSPLWQPSSIKIDCDGGYHLVDPTTTPDLDDNIHEELQVYTQAAVAGQVGYLFAEYDISFTEPVYQPHSTAIPLATGPGQRIVAFDSVLFAANAAWQINSTFFNSTVAGTVVRAVFDLQGSTPAGGRTFANMLVTNQYAHSTTAVTTSFGATPVPMVGGLTVYLVNTSGNNCHAYTSLEAAINGNGTGQLFATDVSVATGGVYNLDIAIVRIGTSSLPAVQ